MTEFELIEQLLARFGGERPGVVVGAGDDAAVVRTGPETLLSVDASFEGTHFRRDLLSPEEIGGRAIAAALSDLAAMGGRAEYALCALTLWPGDADFALRVGDGIAQAVRAEGVAVVGGNISMAPVFSITTTVIGSPIGRPVLRKGARPGDAICLTGPVGGASLAYALLARAGAGSPPPPPAVLDCYRRPRARLDAASTIAKVATAAIDVSDGLVQDLEHLARASGVGARVRLERIPLPAGYLDLSEPLGGDPYRFALSGGEDYEVIFTAPSGADHSFAVIGEVTDGGVVVVLDENGETKSIPPGYRHL